MCVGRGGRRVWSWEEEEGRGALFFHPPPPQTPQTIPSFTKRKNSTSEEKVMRREIARRGWGDGAAVTERERERGERMAAEGAGSKTPSTGMKTRMWERSEQPRPSSGGRGLYSPSPPRRRRRKAV